MNGREVIFIILGAIAAIGAIRVVSTRNVVRGALYLVAVLGSVGAIFLLLGAEFVGWTQILIYVGAIVVLLLFGLMLTKAPLGSAITLDNQQKGIAFLVAAATFGVMTYLIWKAFGHTKIGSGNVVRTAQIGSSLFSKYVLPFEAVSVLLLAALVGAIVLAKRDR
ncbi:MAG: NADH-quinone oxidoreductase subunit J family protein [Actinomycetota bacterium]